MKLFVSAIGTDCGKTVVSSVLCNYLKTDYWKPIQAGFPTDTQTIQRLAPETKTWPEAYLLPYPESPHSAAVKSGFDINLSDFRLPPSQNLIVEGPGGLLVPINAKHTILDLVVHLNLPLVLVVNFYLGSINHTLLTLHLLKTNPHIRVAGLVTCGEINPSSWERISVENPFHFLFHLPKLESLSPQMVQEFVSTLPSSLRSQLEIN